MATRPKLVRDGRFLIPVVVDTREQLAYDFLDMQCDVSDGGGPLTVPTIRGTLASGDYSLEGFELRVAVERKSVADLFGTIGQGRDRFERELARLAEMEFAAVVIEGEWSQILGIHPNGLLELQQELMDRIDQCDTSQPWSRWLDMLSASMPMPPERSQLPPRICFRSITAWEQRFPRVHWRTCINRRHAEVTTFRILERFAKDAARAR